jgi:GNAT superfamily N-acetyltransferase
MIANREGGGQAIQSNDLPPGKVKLVTWHLEMFQKPEHAAARPRPEDLDIFRVEKPPIHFYRYLYTTVGAPWVWWERRIQSDEAIMADLHDTAFDFFVPYQRGVPVGMMELNGREFPEVQLNYFGLIPERCGLGIGGYLLDWMADEVFARGATRFWVHTCSLDSPRALPAYQRAGFMLYNTVEEIVDDPRTLPGPT